MNWKDMIQGEGILSVIEEYQIQFLQELVQSRFLADSSLSKYE